MCVLAFWKKSEVPGSLGASFPCHSLSNAAAKGASSAYHVERPQNELGGIHLFITAMGCCTTCVRTDSSWASLVLSFVPLIRCISCTAACTP
jgi:hypothetical protein